MQPAAALVNVARAMVGKERTRMTSASGSPAAGGWDWIRQGTLELGGCLIFVRDASPERVIEGFEMDPAAAVVLPEARAGEAIRFPICDDEANTIAPYIRVGRVGEWAFAVSGTGLDIVDYHDAAATRLSAGTDAVMVIWTMTVNDVEYLADGEQVVSFQPEMAWYRYGSDPDRFLAEMRQARLETEPPSPDDDPGAGQEYRDEVIAALDMLTLVLGIRLPEEVVSGPLLTVQRAPDGTSPRG
jgi:hypothetical protein